MKKLSVVDEMSLKHFQDRAMLAMENIKRTRREDCPRCPSADSEVAGKCSSRLDADTETHGFMDGPMCRHVEEKARQAADEELTKRRAERMKHAGVPDPEVIKTLAALRVMPQPPRSWYGPDQAKREAAMMVVDGAQSWLVYPDCRCLVITGDVGTGKSTAAAWIVAGTQDNALWLSARMVDSIERWKPVAELAYRVGLLVIDDLGTERESESGWGTDTLGGLLVDRLDSGKRTVVTTNLNGTGLVKRYGDRLRSRLSRRPQVGLIEAGTTDLRRMKREYQQRMGEVKS
jgi:DNA replication protein DnaC